jgi:hypothetical protein
MDMRSVAALICGGALVLTGCGSDGDAGGGGGGSGSEPTITMVAWEAAANCTTSQTSDVIVTVTATDPDTDAADLIYRGSVSGCSGPINAARSTISCPNVSPYPGNATVSDPDGNDSTPVAFTVPICASGSESFP